MSNITDALPISTADLKRMGIGIPDYQNSIVIRSRNEVTNVSYSDNVSLYSKYVTIDDPITGRDGYQVVSNKSTTYTRTITAKVSCQILVVDGGNPVGIKTDGATSWVSFPLGFSNYPGAHTFKLNDGDALMIRTSSKDASDVDPNVIILIPYK